jgi:hypothetical protein
VLSVTDALSDAWQGTTALSLGTPLLPLSVNATKLSQSYNCSSGIGFVDLAATATSIDAVVAFRWQFGDGAPPASRRPARSWRRRT